MDIELTKAVAAVRQELIDASQQGVGQQIAFTVGPIEMEFAVELRADTKAKAGFRAWVLSADAEVGVARGRTHRVKVTVTPKSPDGGDLLISARSAAPLEPGDTSEHRGR